MVRSPNDFIAHAKTISEKVDNTSAINLYCLWIKSGADVDEYIRDHLPPVDGVSLSDVCDSNDPAVLSRAGKWMDQQKIAFVKTIAGPYVDAMGGQQLTEFLGSAIPIYPAFASFCTDAGLPVSPASYYKVVVLCKSGYLFKTRWHPLYSEFTEFWMQSEDALMAIFNRWASQEDMEFHVDDGRYMSVAEAAAYMGIGPVKLLDWLYSHPGCCAIEKGRYLLDRNWVSLVTDTWSHAVRVVDMVDDLVSFLPAGKRTKCKAATLAWVQEKTRTWILDADSYPQHSDGMYIAEDSQEDAQSDLLSYIYTFHAWPIGVLKTYTGYSTAQLKAATKKGLIVGELQDNGDYLITTDEKYRIQAIAEQFISLDAVVSDAITEGCKFNISTTAHRANFLRFAKDNDWWDICITSGDDYPINSGRFNTLVLTDDADELRRRISSWIRGYGQDCKTQLALLLKHYQDVYPKTVSKIRKKYAHKDIASAFVDMLDFLLYLLPRKELMDLTKAETDTIIGEFADNATLISSQMLATFLYENKITSRRYIFEGTGYKRNTKAYSVEKFAVMVAPIVNDGVIKELELIRKAVENPKCAALWLYVAVHVYASWRNTDYERLYAPPLQYPPQTTLEMISNGTYTVNDAKKVADAFITEQRLRWMKPNKTKRLSGVKPLYFFCPEDCKPIFGLILSIAAAHHYLGDQKKAFIRVVNDRATIATFFGEHFLAACDGDKFSGLRANKALMQAVEYEGREEGRYNPLVAYYLASHMRSHKADYGKIAKTTDIYLRDANFAGLSADYVLYQMFQRGTCSFVADVMINQCYGKQYASLSVAAKTEAIRSLGVSMSQLDIALRSTQTAMDTAVSIVKSLSLKKQDMNAALRTIAAGRAHGKDMDTQCLAKAADQDCKCPDRIGCLGCKYELPTKAMLIKYYAEHQNCQKKGLTPMERAKNEWIDSNIIVPKLTEIIAHMSECADVEELQMYIDLMEEVRNNGYADDDAV